MKSKPATESGCESSDISRLLDPDFHDIFIDVINMLDLASFSRLSRSSSQLQDFCLFSKGISVPVDLWLDVHVSSGKPIFTLWRSCPEKRRFWTVKRSDYEKFFGSRVLAFNFQAINFICDIDDEVLRGTMKFLKKFSKHAVKRIVLRGDVSDWSDVTGFMQEKKVKQLVLGYHFTTNLEIAPSIPDDLLRNLLENKLDYFCYAGHAICDDFVLHSTIPSMNLRGAEVSKTTFKALIEKCASSTSEIQWRIGRQPPSFRSSSAPMKDAFHDVLDSFFSLDFQHEGAVPSNRPLLFTRLNDDPAYGNSRWILRSDGKLVSFSFDWNHLYFSMSPRAQHPPCLLKNTPIS